MARRSLAGRRVLVTGGSSGIGAAAATSLAYHGARVAVSGRDSTALDKVAATCGGPALVGDLLAPGAAEAMVERAAASLGGLDTLVCSAGTGWAGPLAAMPPTQIDAMVALNLAVPMRMVRAALPAFDAAGEGHVVLVGSVAGRMAVPGETVYSATKAGLAGFADGLRAELAGGGITVSLVNPAAVATAFFDRRNRPYERSWPRPMPVTRVAAAIVRCVATGRPEVVVPRWMAMPMRLRGAAPGVFWALAHRFG
jgi:short-subunit dehydrogenase